MPYLQNMTPSDLKEAVKKDLPLFIAAGSIEYHGSQLPLGTDLFIVEGVLREIEKKTDIVIAPSFTFCPTGYMVSGADKGTVDVRIGTFIEYCSEILSSYKNMGFKHIYVLTHHQCNSVIRYLDIAIEQINAYSRYEDLGYGWWTNKVKNEKDFVIKAVPTVFGEDVAKEFFGHGGKGETQPVMALYPELVQMDKLTADEAFWNSTAAESDKQASEKALELLVNQWVDKINRGDI